jgi:hypothetical protein
MPTLRISVLLFACVLVACQPPVDGVATTSTTTTTLSTSTTHTPPQGCSLPPLPVEGTAISSTLDVDYDRDGVVDTFTTYLLGGAWIARLELSDGDGDETTVEGTDELTEVRPIGGHDINEDGVPEAFVSVGAGAATQLVGLFGVDGCALFRIKLGAAGAVFPIGATVANVSGLSCQGSGDLDRVFASTTDGTNYEGGSEPYRLDGDRLVPGTADAASFTAEEAGSLARLDCGSLSLF